MNKINKTTNIILWNNSRLFEYFKNTFQKTAKKIFKLWNLIFLSSTNGFH